eukprot:CAMPEP_0178376562 /NCGR_PEP_ID=MMETSP0689_2-20121128/3467_1 /TAXON_ID=160604 /ORGANISM="Amphidinium massartii, Strain CS-259" /LENGTH=749 /DNA_ID=CAMNT_0019996589 /DNA_START=92 /DNA_END=2338 /DNA_ORIENTATION=-
MSKLSRARAFKNGEVKDLPSEQEMASYEEVDFSQNNLSSTGFKKVLQTLESCKKLRILKLFKNELDDADAESLAAFILKCPTLDEVHLSHNHFTGAGVESIVAASEKDRPTDAKPMWLRLEQNDVEDPGRVLDRLQSKFSVCPRYDARRCSTRACVYGKKVHVPHFHFQRGGPQDGGPRDVKRKRRRRDEDQGDWHGGRQGDWAAGGESWKDYEWADQKPWRSRHRKDSDWEVPNVDGYEESQRWGARQSWQERGRAGGPDDFEEVPPSKRRRVRIEEPRMAKLNMTRAFLGALDGVANNDKKGRVKAVLKAKEEDPGEDEESEEEEEEGAAAAAEVKSELADFDVEEGRGEEAASEDGEAAAAEDEDEESEAAESEEASEDGEEDEAGSEAGEPAEGAKVRQDGPAQEADAASEAAEASPPVRRRSRGGEAAPARPYGSPRARRGDHYHERQHRRELPQRASRRESEGHRRHVHERDRSRSMRGRGGGRPAARDSRSRMNGIDTLSDTMVAMSIDAHPRIETDITAQGGVLRATEIATETVGEEAVALVAATGGCSAIPAELEETMGAEATAADMKAQLHATAADTALTLEAPAAAENARRQAAAAAAARAPSPRERQRRSPPRSSQPPAAAAAAAEALPNFPKGFATRPKAKPGPPPASSAAATAALPSGTMAKPKSASRPTRREEAAAAAAAAEVSKPAPAAAAQKAQAPAAAAKCEDNASEYTYYSYTDEEDEAPAAAQGARAAA